MEGGQGEAREVLPKRGLVYQESNPGLVLCKPKLLPLNSVTLEKLERMQKEAQTRAKEMQAAAEREQQEGTGGFIGGGGGEAEVLTLEHGE
jgi:BBSome-interacting protein 1